MKRANVMGPCARISSATIAASGVARAVSAKSSKAEGVPVTPRCYGVRGARANGGAWATGGTRRCTDLKSSSDRYGRLTNPAVLPQIVHTGG